MKIKRPELSDSLSEAISNPGNYNFAEFLSFDAARIVKDTMGLCKKRNIAVSSSALLYSSLKISKDI